MDYRKKLEKERDKISKTIKEMEDNTLFGDTTKHTSEKYSTGELSSYDNHIGDIGTDVYMQDMDNSLIDHQKYVLNGINEALNKVNDGNYGICSNCHKKIEQDRLDLIPETTLCATCAKEIDTSPDESESMDKNPLNSYNDMYYSEYIKDLTYLNKNGIDQKRDGALLILRSDIEANLDDEKIRQIEQTTLKYFKDVVYDDTAKGPGILSKYREEKIEEMLKKYRKCQLVITDRLHGMIFAAITSTPCIALGNYNHKIKSCSEILEHLGYIKYVDNVEEIDENIKYLMSNKFEKYDNKFALEQFKKIKEETLKLFR